MTEAQNRGMKFAYFLIGVALPILGTGALGKMQRDAWPEQEGARRPGARCHSGRQLSCKRSTLGVVSSGLPVNRPLFIAESFGRIQLRSAAGGQESEADAYRERDAKGDKHGNRRDRNIHLVCEEPDAEREG